jgi:hypothetical protein
VTKEGDVDHHRRAASGVLAKIAGGAGAGQAGMGECPGHAGSQIAHGRRAGQQHQQRDAAKHPQDLAKEAVHQGGRNAFHGQRAADERAPHQEVGCQDDGNAGEEQAAQSGPVFQPVEEHAQSRGQDHHEEDLGQGQQRPHPGRQVIRDDEDGNESDNFDQAAPQIRLFVVDDGTIVDQDHRDDEPQVGNQRVVAPKGIHRTQAQ